jgi:hypothetical protein
MQATLATSWFGRAASRPGAAAARLAGAALADLVADEFVYGRGERISREAPVLILRHDKTDVLLGGGANRQHPHARRRATATIWPSMTSSKVAGVAAGCRPADHARSSRDPRSGRS